MNSITSSAGSLISWSVGGCVMEVKHRNSTDARARMVKDTDTGTSARQENSHRLTGSHMHTAPKSY